MDEIFLNSLWIHVHRDFEQVYNSNIKFYKQRNKDEFFKVYNKRKTIWENSIVSKNAFNINYSKLKSKQDIIELIHQLETFFKIKLNDKKLKSCVELFREKKLRLINSKIRV